MADTKEEKIKNCGHCKKPVSRAKRYYRDGIFYCNKSHFKAKVKASKEKVES